MTVIGQLNLEQRYILFQTNLGNPSFYWSTQSMHLLFCTIFGHANVLLAYTILEMLLLPYKILDTAAIDSHNLENAVLVYTILEMLLLV